MLLIACASSKALAQEPSPEAIDFFERKIRPVFAESCFQCHGAKKSHAGLRLDSRSAVLRGSDYGVIVTPAKPEASKLLKVLRHEIADLKMPKQGAKLSPENIADIAQWIRMDLPWPKEAPSSNDPSAIANIAATHWAFQPITQPALPETSDPAWLQTPVDAFILARMDSETEFSPAAPADRAALLRRLHHRLIGLPPSFEEQQTFAADDRPDAVQRQTDRLLASPAYGQRWARHWLDLARYADTKGYVFQEDRNFPFAYAYRDWVVDALNRDIPFDRFIGQQIAADQFPEAEREVAAMGFLTVGRRFLNRKPDIIDDRIDMVTRGVMGLTVACARCHAHKFDPVSTEDYYALYGVFDSSEQPLNQPVLTYVENGSGYPDYLEKRDELALKVHEYLKSQLPNYKIPEALHAIDKVALERMLKARDLKDQFRKRHNAYLKLDVDHPDAPPRAMMMVDRSKPVDAPVFIRGNPSRKGAKVPRRFIDFLKGGKAPSFAADRSGRMELVDEMMSHDNPLTARVWVNRVWGWQFGQFLVDSPSNFGVQTPPPSHPELLDFLAADFQTDWSIKRLQRSIVSSATFQQSSVGSEAGLAQDPANVFLSRMRRARMEFEPMRDALLAASGDLDLALGGKAEKLEANPATHRRAVYGFIERQNLPGIFRTFDFAGPDAHVPFRYETTSPKQALYFLNHPFPKNRARSLAAQLRTAHPNMPKAQVEQLFRRVLTREPDSEELAFAVEFLNQAEVAPAVNPWAYGMVKLDESRNKVVQFRELKHRKGGTLSGTGTLPDPDWDWASLTATGGHPGAGMHRCVSRRWTAPVALTLTITGALKHDKSQGDGVRAQVISDRQGRLGEWTVNNGKAAAILKGVRVEAGEQLDFVVDFNGTITHDSFTWAPVILKAGGGARWSAKEEFDLTVSPSLTRLEQLAHAMLGSNEFLFVD